MYPNIKSKILTKKHPFTIVFQRNVLPMWQFLLLKCTHLCYSKPDKYPLNLTKFLIKSIKIQKLTLLWPACQNIHSPDWFTYFYQKALKCDTFYSKVKGADGSWKLTAWDGTEKILQVEENELRPRPIFSQGVGDRNLIYNPNSTTARLKKTVHNSRWCALKFCELFP